MVALLLKQELYIIVKSIKQYEFYSKLPPLSCHHFMINAVWCTNTVANIKMY